MNIKGVSPMVATLLLIFFAVALGTVIMTWGSSYAAQQGHLEEKREESLIRCERFINVEIKESCSSEIKKRISFSVTNHGNIPIDGFRIILIGTKNFETTFFDLNDVHLEPGETRQFHQNYDFSRLGSIGQLEVFPKIFLDDTKKEYFRCPDKLVVESISEC